MQSRTALILVSCGIGPTPILVRPGTTPISVCFVQFKVLIPILVQLPVESAPLLVQLLV